MAKQGFRASLGAVRGLRLKAELLLMIYILHYLKGPRLWESWYISYNGDAGFTSSIVGCAGSRALGFLRFYGFSN